VTRSWPRGSGLVVALMMGCGPPPPAPAVAAPPVPTFFNDTRPLRFHSARFELSLPLPDGHGWRIDDHSAPLLVATHRVTGSTVTLGIFTMPELVNRQRCEAVARERGLAPDVASLGVVEQAITVGPGAYDTQWRVALETRNAVPVGHVFLFGAYVHKCLFGHYETRIGPGEDEASLSAKLAIARVQILGAVTLEAFDQPGRAPLAGAAPNPHPGPPPGTTGGGRE